MIDFKYLYKGLCGLARAIGPIPWRGIWAAVVAGYFLGEDHPDLDGKVHRAVERELDRVIQGEEPIWFDQKKAGISIAELFEPFPDETPDEKNIATIAKALSNNIDKTRQSGHNVIFSATALRALHDHPIYATPSIVAGIRKLIIGFNGAVPGRGYYGNQRGWIVGNQVDLASDNGFPPYRNQQSMVDVVVNEVIRAASIRKQGFGGLFHIINHAAALTELSLFGYHDLSRRGLASHRQHVRLWRSLPNVEQELGTLRQAENDPRTPAYWNSDAPSQWSARLTHRIKTMYGFFTLLRSVTQTQTREKAEKQFLYLMA